MTRNENVKFLILKQNCDWFSPCWRRPELRHASQNLLTLEGCRGVFCGYGLQLLKWIVASAVHVKWSIKGAEYRFTPPLFTMTAPASIISPCPSISLPTIRQSNAAPPIQYQFSTQEATGSGLVVQEPWLMQSSLCFPHATHSDWNFQPDDQR